MRVDLSQGLNKMTAQNGINKNSEKSFENILNQLEDDNKDDKKLREACQQFESVFIHKMFSQMRQAIPKSDFMGNSQSEEIFQDMLDQEYSQQISKSGGIGLADILYNELAAKNTETTKNEVDESS